MTGNGVSCLHLIYTAQCAGVCWLSLARENLQLHPFTSDNWDQKCIGLSKRKDWFRVKWLQELQRLITLPQVNHTVDNLFPLCFNLANGSIHDFPTIRFHFIDASGNGTVHFVLAPENYISLYCRSPLHIVSLYYEAHCLWISLVTLHKQTIKWFSIEWITELGGHLHIVQSFKFQVDELMKI
jgi:hypothetical protein